MTTLNRWTGLGRLGRDADVRNTASGREVMNFSMATNHAWRDNEGNIHEETEWHTVVYWARGEDGSHAKFAPLMTKGTQVLVTGRIRTRVWDDRNGEKRQRKEIIANDVILTGNRAKRSDGTADGEATDGSDVGRRTPDMEPPDPEPGIEIDE